MLAHGILSTNINDHMVQQMDDDKPERNLKFSPWRNLERRNNRRDLSFQYQQ